MDTLSLSLPSSSCLSLSLPPPPPLCASLPRSHLYVVVHSSVGGQFLRLFSHLGGVTVTAVLRHELNPAETRGRGGATLKCRHGKEECRFHAELSPPPPLHHPSAGHTHCGRITLYIRLQFSLTAKLTALLYEQTP